MRVLAIAVLFSSFSTFACPNLAGTFASCKSRENNSESSKNLTISQEIKNRVTYYKIESSVEELSTYKADGKTQVTSETDEDSGIKISTATTASCIGSELRVKIVAKFADEIILDVVRTYSKNGHQLTQKTAGTMADAPVDDTVICE